MSSEPYSHQLSIEEHVNEEYATEKPTGPKGTVNTRVPLITLRSVIMGAFLSIGGLLFGYDTGQISGFQEMSGYLQRFGEYSEQKGWHFSPLRNGLIVGLLSVGTLIGALVAAPIADFVGRKWSITFWNIVLVIGVIVQITSPDHHWWQIVVGRFVTGLGVGSCSLYVFIDDNPIAKKQPTDFPLQLGPNVSE